MKPRVVLLYTQDPDVEQLLARVLVKTEAVVLVARSASEALQIVCDRGRELDFGVLDFNTGCHGMTLLSAIHSCYKNLPTLVVISENQKLSSALADASGEHIFLTKPLSAALLCSTIENLGSTDFKADCTLFIGARQITGKAAISKQM